MTVENIRVFHLCEVKKEIGYRIRKLRESKDYSQENMGGELGITAGAYAKIERGETDPSATRLLQIAEILGVDVYTFFHDGQTRFLTPMLVNEQASYGYASKRDIAELTEIVNKLRQDMEMIRKQLVSVKKAPTARKPR